MLSESLYPEMLPRLNIWPKGFLKSGPKDENIGLYFFPQNERFVIVILFSQYLDWGGIHHLFCSRNDVMYFLFRSYEKEYSTLVDHMIENDLAMKAPVANADLLIFTSMELPLNNWSKHAEL